jgi:Branched-chain amino acid transport system / permease component
MTTTCGCPISVAGPRLRRLLGLSVDYPIDLTIVGLSLGMGLRARRARDILHLFGARHRPFRIRRNLYGRRLSRRDSAEPDGAPYPALIVIAMLLTGVIGAAIERLFYRRLTRAGGSISFAGMGIIIAGFGISMVLQNIAFLIWTAKAVPLLVQFGPPIEIGELMLPRSYLWIVAVTLVLMATLHAFLKYTKIGLAVRAVAHNKDIAYLMGINVPLMISLLFGIGCAMGAAAGVLIRPINYVQVSMGRRGGWLRQSPGGDSWRPDGWRRREPRCGLPFWQLQGHLRFCPADGASIRNSRNHRQDQSVGIGRSGACSNVASMCPFKRRVC